VRDPLLLRYVRQTWDSLDPHRALSYRRAVDRDDTVRRVQIDREHEAIVVALEAGDPGTAQRLLAEHRAGGRASFHHYLKAES
jgi:DNA-binding GntR family transcriptional regulator